LIVTEKQIEYLKKSERSNKGDIMLTIKLGNYIADLANNELSIVRTSPYPLMAIGSQGGNFIFNFTLPATVELKQEFKYAHRPQVKNPFVELPFRINAGAGIVFEGMAKVTEASRDLYEIMCPVENGDFNYLAKQVKLNELDLGGDRVTDVDQQRVKANVAYNIDVNLTQEEDFSHDLPLPFENITLNPDNELNVTGDKFTSAEVGSVTLRFDFDIYSNLSNLIDFRLLKNGTEVGSKLLNGYYDETFIIDIDVEIGDELTWYIYLEAANTGFEYRIDFWVYPGTALSITRSVSAFMINIAENKYPDVDLAIFPIQNPEIFSNWADDFYQVDNLSIKTLYNQYFKVVNYWKNAGFPSFLSGEAEVEEGVTQFFNSGNIFIPFPYFAYLVKRIAHHFGFAIENNPFEDELKYTVLINHFVENEFLDNSTKIFKAKSGFNLQDHVPDWTVYDLLKHLGNLFGMSYEIDNQRKLLTFNFLENILTELACEDITHLVTDPLKVNPERKITGIKLIQKGPSSDKYFENVKSLEGLNYMGVAATFFDLPAAGTLNDCYYVTLLSGYYVWKYNPDTYRFDWVRHSNNFITEIETGINTQELSSELCPILMRSPQLIDDVLGSTGRGWLIPASHQAGKFEGAPEMFQTKWVAGILFYHGMYPDSKAADYPFASNDIYDPSGAAIDGAELSLRLDGENGLYEKKWKRYLTWRTTTPSVTVRILPDDKFLQGLKFSKKYSINGVNYLIAEYRGSIGRNGAGIAELTLLPY
jgi:hypothetical protein